MVIEGTRAWLAGELSDWGASDDALLSQAMENLAAQFVDDDAEFAPAGRGALPSG